MKVNRRAVLASYVRVASRIGSTIDWLLALCAQGYEVWLANRGLDTVILEDLRVESAVPKDFPKRLSLYGSSD
jgi:hypothetical protein